MANNLMKKEVPIKYDVFFFFFLYFFMIKRDLDRPGKMFYLKYFLLLLLLK